MWSTVMVAIRALASIALVVAVQARDTRVAPAGAAVLAGTVVSAETSAPVRDARVALTGETLPVPLLVITDDQGAFAFTDLSAGEYQLWAAKIGYVTVNHGERRPGSGRAGKPIVLADRQRLDRLTLRMPRAGVVNGSVFDEFGEPALGVMVEAIRFVTVAGRRTLAPAGIGEVDDRGVFRIASLPPGEYLITATAGPSLSRAFMAGASRGTADGTSPPSVLFGLRPPVNDAPRAGYVSVYYPGSAAISGASAIVLNTGEERSGIDFRLRRVPLARVSGTVRDTDGSLVRGDVRLSEMPPGGASVEPEARWHNVRLDDEGRFSFQGVPPGQYTVAVRQRATDDRVPSAARWALQDVSVAGANVDLELRLQSAITASGTVVSDVGSLPEFAGGVVFVPAPESRFLAEHVALHAGVTRNGRFTMPNLTPGRFQIEFRSNLPEWRLTSAMFGGRDAADFLLDVKPGDHPTGILTLTSRDGELAGIVSSATSAPVDSLTVVAFAAEERFWIPGNRRNQAASLDSKGRYVFRNLPAGTYRLAAIDDFDPVAGLDPVLLRQLAASSAVLLTLAEGERRSQDLRIK